MRYYFSLILAFLASAISSLPAQVGFIADKVEGCGSLTVKFRDTTTAPIIINSLWDFGDARTSKELSPTHTYTKPGPYNVSLTINGAHSPNVTKLNYITVRPMPRADFTIIDSISSGPYLFNFYAAAQDSTKYKYYYNWTFSDNKVDSLFVNTLPVVVHTFDSIGLYYANLTVTDSFGCITTYKHLIRVVKPIVVPNIFTPNDDGRNDVLEVQTDGKTKFLFRVFSASGIMVFKTESVFIRWGGENLSGAKLNGGVYYYTIESLDPANPITQSGFIYLLR